MSAFTVQLHYPFHYNLQPEELIAAVTSASQEGGGEEVAPVVQYTGSTLSV